MSAVFHGLSEHNLKQACLVEYIMPFIIVTRILLISGTWMLYESKYLLSSSSWPKSNAEVLPNAKRCKVCFLQMDQEQMQVICLLHIHQWMFAVLIFMRFANHRKMRLTSNLEKCSECPLKSKDKVETIIIYCSSSREEYCAIHNTQVKVGQMNSDQVDSPKLSNVIFCVNVCNFIWLGWGLAWKMKLHKSWNISFTNNPNNIHTPIITCISWCSIYHHV